MTKQAIQLKQKADEAKYLYNMGEIEFKEMRDTVQEYIDYCNGRAKVIAKEYGMKPKFMSTKAYMR